MLFGFVDKEFYDTQTNSVSIYRFGNRQAFVVEEVTLLQPECLWYPQGVALLICPHIDLILPVIL
ncbi:MAG: hypothetical protein V8R91_15700 [Butyricimonas faecihominis]